MRDSASISGLSIGTNEMLLRCVSPSQAAISLHRD